MKNYMMIPKRNTQFPSPPPGRNGWPWTMEGSRELVPINKIHSDLKISIITPSYNQGQFIEETIRSVLLQNYTNIEYIIIDGGSTDNSIDIIKKYQNNIAYWISEPDRGQTHAINKGLAIATGDIVAYLNSDDMYLPDSFTQIIEFFNNNPDIDMVYGNLVHIDKQSNMIDVMECGKLDVFKLFSFHYYLPQATVFLRHEIVKKIGPFDEKLNLNMDYDYWVRLSFFGKIAHIPKELACARLYPEAKSQFFSQDYLQENLIILEKYKNLIKKLDNSELLLFHAYASIYFYGGLSYLKRGDLVLGLKNIRTAIKYNKYIIFNLVSLYSVFCWIFGENLISHIVFKTMRALKLTSFIYHR
jgi:glycosyltransferase involved in cell wall biosynthesis